MIPLPKRLVLFIVGKLGYTITKLPKGPIIEVMAPAEGERHPQRAPFSVGTPKLTKKSRVTPPKPKNHSLKPLRFHLHHVGGRGRWVPHVSGRKISRWHRSVNHLVELLGGPVVYIPKRPGEPDCTFADIDKIRQRLRWASKVSFEEGVKRMLERLDDWRDAPVWDPASIHQATASWFRYLGNEASC